MKHSKYALLYRLNTQSFAPLRSKPFLLSALTIALLANGCTSERHLDSVSEVQKETPVMVAEDESRAMVAGKVPDIDLSTARTAVKLEHQQIAKTLEQQKLSRFEMKRAPYPLPAGELGYYRQPQPLEVDRENYLAQTDNPIQQVETTPVSTFSVDVDTASYTNVRRMIQREGRLPPHDAVKVEEFINYFSYQYPQPESTEQPFSVHTELMTSPWHAQRKLLKIGLQGYQPQQRPAANLVFLVDVSGSMRSEHKLGLAKRSLKMLAQQMRKDDRIALVVYAGAAGLVLPSTAGDQKQTIFSAIDQLTAGGSTHGSAGIQLAYQVAQEHFIKDGINRVLVASDGDMNVGTVDLNALKDLVSHQRQSGIALSTLGFGGGNYNYALMEQLADVGDGNASYVDSLSEAHRVLVQQLNSTLMTIAKDVKIQVEFNAQYVSEYRLIGYENRLLKREDFRNDKVDAGEIGAGHSVTALYELSLVDSGSESMAALRYGRAREVETQAAAIENFPAELGFVKLRYKQPNSSTSQLLSLPLNTGLLDQSRETSADMRFSAAVAGFAQLLRGGTYMGSWNYDDLLALARSGKGEDRYGHRAEMVKLIELSQQWQLAQQ
jgi:Ca-activated chloride channel homolog